MHLSQLDVVAQVAQDSDIGTEQAITNVARSFALRRRKHSRYGLRQVHFISDEERDTNVAVVPDAFVRRVSHVSRQNVVVCKPELHPMPKLYW